MYWTTLILQLKMRSSNFDLYTSIGHIQYEILPKSWENSSYEVASLIFLILKKKVKRVSKKKKMTFFKYFIASFGRMCHVQILWTL